MRPALPACLISRGILAIVCASLVACGGGEGEGVEPEAAPAIAGALLAFLPGQAPEDLELGAHNVAAIVQVFDQHGVALRDATVLVNGASLQYDPQEYAYAAALSATPGSSVQLLVHIDGRTYGTSATLPAEAPSIVAPLDNAGWAANTINSAQWQVATQPQSVQMLGLVSGQYTYPADGFVEIEAGARSFDIPANHLQAGDFTLMVGAGERIPISGAIPGSALVVSTLGTRRVRVRHGVSGVTGMRITGMSEPALLVKDASQQLEGYAETPGGGISWVTLIGHWHSADPGVVSVTHDGVITAVSAGSTIVSISYGGHTANLPVRVIDPGPWAGATVRTHSVAYQVDYGHSGHVTLAGTPLQLPLQDKWSVQLGGEVIYPLIAEGRVFVITRGPVLTAGAHLHALDVTTGNLAWGPIHIPGTLNVAYHAYDDGKVFVSSVDGVLQAFDAATGTLLWETALAGNDVEAPPVAVNGLLYVLAHGSYSALFAIDQQLGQTLWSSPILGTWGSPALGIDGAYLNYQGRVYKFNRLTGQPLWSTPGQFGLATTPVLAGSRLFVRHTSSALVTTAPPNAILDAATGENAGTFPGTGMPAVAGDYSYHVVQNRLVRLHVPTQQQRWEFVGDEQLIAPALVIDEHVVVASRSGNVYLLATETGAELWSGQVPPPTDVWDEHKGSMGVGDGYLLVPGGSTLTGWKLVP